jgi:outer membrane protein OmpA-like peptidoglycan-associated protein
LKKSDADNNTFSKSDGSFQILLSENDQTGFYALDKNMFSSLAYINLKETPLKILDDSGMPNLAAKDSLRLLNIEKLQIRLTNLNLLITDLDRNPVTAKSLDFAHLPDLISESNSFEVNQKLERQRLAYNQKYGKNDNKNDLTSVENAPKSTENGSQIPIVEDSSPENTSRRIEIMKKGFEEKKKSKETPNIPFLDSSKNNNIEISKEEERQAIEEVKDLHGANENSPDFDVLLANTQRKIVLSSITDVKEELQKEFIQAWDNWQVLGFNAEEERKVKNKLNDTQRRLKQNLEERNTLEESRNGSTVVFSDDETNVAKEIKRSVINNLRSYLRPAILQEINYQMAFRLNNELRSALYKILEKEKRNGKNIPNLPIVEEKNEDADFAENEQKSHFTIVMYPLKANINIPLNGIYFKQNTADLLPESEAELTRMQRLFEDDPFRVIELSGHTHGYCSTEFADLITQNRLQNIKKAMIARGVSENHIWLHPYGKNAPLAPNNTLEGRLLNQRIEMKLTNR